MIPVDGFLVDLGVSSPQLDRAERGFSFRRDGPLDMRMDPTTGETAAELLRRVDEDELTRIIRDYGEERYAARVARAIVEARRAGAARDHRASWRRIVARALPRHERNKNPATRTFQALRIAVNDELDELERFLAVAADCLRPGGRLVRDRVPLAGGPDRQVAAARAGGRAAAQPARPAAAPAADQTRRGPGRRRARPQPARAVGAAARGGEDLMPCHRRRSSSPTSATGAASASGRSCWRCARRARWRTSRCACTASRSRTRWARAAHQHRAGRSSAGA